MGIPKEDRREQETTGVLTAEQFSALMTNTKQQAQETQTTPTG